LPAPSLISRHAIGNQAAQRLLRTGQSPSEVLTPHSITSNQSLQRTLRFPTHQTPLQRQPTPDTTTSTWTQKRTAANSARAARNAPEADKLTREAIAEAAAQATYPTGVVKTAPTPDQIQLDPKITDHAYAQVRPKTIPANPNDYWRWIFFAPGLIDGSEIRARMFITHELVHIAQFNKVWSAYQADTSPTKPAWDDYLQPFQKRDRVEGPEELEAHITSLDFLTRLATAEQTTALRGLFSAYVSTGSYKPPTGETVAITTAAVRPRILASFNAAPDPLKERMGQELWWSLLNNGPDKSVWISTLRELKPLALKAYANPTFRQLYDEALASEGIKPSSWR
jgi:hypothetical protein